MRKTVFVMLAMALVPFCAFAVDGQVLINQSTLTAAGGTYTITQPGSYKLSGNLLAKDQNTDVILIAADHVTLDLNGFAILGTAVCTPGVFPCANAGNGSGITYNTNHHNITIRNGTIQGMGSDGIQLFGDSQLVEYMHLRQNGHNGISIMSQAPDQGSIVQHNIAQHNGNYGITISQGLVTHNICDANERGIVIAYGSVSYNVVTNNSDAGLFLFAAGGGLGGNYIGNVATGNKTNSNSDNVYVYLAGTWVNQGQNLCGSAACPGAVF